MAKGAEQRPAQPQSDQAVQKPTFMDRARSAMPSQVEGRIFTRSLLRIPHLNMAEPTQPQQSSTPSTERDLWIATDRYARGVPGSKKQLKEVEQRDAEATKAAIYELAGLEPSTPKEKP